MPKETPVPATDPSRQPPTPTWVKALLVAAIVGAATVVVLHLAGLSPAGH